MIKTVSLLILAILIFPTNSFGKEADEIQISHPRVRLLPSAATTTGAFMELKNTGKNNLKLVSASSNKAKTVELHTHIKKDGMMSMVEVESIVINAGATVQMKPGSYHIMLIGLNSPTKVGENITINLKFSDGSTKTVSAKTVDIRKHKH